MAIFKSVHKQIHKLKMYRISSRNGNLKKEHSTQYYCRYWKP